MFVSKPVPAGKVAELDGSGKDVDVQDLTALPGAELLPMQQPGDFTNPDNAKGTLAAVPGVMDGAPQGAIRSGNVSGKGMLQKTAQTSAPMSNPFPPAK
jgi:hypothetical protein